jgi:hypothetical protein
MRRNPAKIDSHQTNSLGPESSFSLNRQAQSLLRPAHSQQSLDHSCTRTICLWVFGHILIMKLFRCATLHCSRSTCKSTRAVVGIPKIFGGPAGTGRQGQQQQQGPAGRGHPPLEPQPTSRTSNPIRRGIGDCAHRLHPPLSSIT